MIGWLEANMIPCFFKEYLNISCITCGMQRSIIALLKGDFQESFFLYPPLLFNIALIMFIVLHLIFKFSQGASVSMWFFIINLIVMMVSYIIKMSFLV